MEEDRERVVESELKGLTLRIYWHILGSNKVKVGVLKNFVGLLGFLLPRYFFYSTMFTVMLVLYPFLYPPNLSVHNIMALVFGVTAAGVSWNETLRVWRMRPF
ncbi:hypothetical protein E6H36_09020 [Candidatus Bathyarchaeota archaeon]|nr:MAG: hypothetical protein E6H36_09020 [Candidatus Bathyarchaeota archaeon]